MKVQALSFSLLIAILLEFGLVIFFRGLPSMTLNPLLYLITGISIGVIPLWMIRKGISPEPFPFLKWGKNIKIPDVAWYGLFFLLSLVSVFILSQLFENEPITIEKSDVLPITKVYIQRLFGTGDGMAVYDFYGGFGYPFYPTHLPLQWLPFVPAELFGFDYRWVPFFVFMIGSFLLLKLIIRSDSPLLIKGIFFLLPFASLNFIALKGSLQIMLTQSVEFLDVGYYMIFCYGLLSAAYWIRQTGLIAIILSRFSLIFWLLVYFLSLKSFKKMVIQGSILFVAVCLIYIIPFLSQAPDSFVNGQKPYTEATEGEWSRPCAKGVPCSMEAGLGMAVYLYKTESLPTPDKVKIIRLLHLSLAIFMAMGLGWYYWKYQRKNQDRMGLFLVASLKIYLTVFYAFVQIPYPSLFLVPLFVSPFLGLWIIKDVAQSIPKLSSPKHAP